MAAAVCGLRTLPAAVSLGLADLRLHALAAAVCGLHALPAAVLLGLADLGLRALPAVVCLADLLGGTYVGMLSSRSLFLDRLGISVLST